MPARASASSPLLTAISICSTCYRRIEAKIVFEQGRVYMLERRAQHGGERVLVAEYYQRVFGKDLPESVVGKV